MLVGRGGGPGVSVVIPTFNSIDTIGPVLQALIDQETDLRYEVIVVESSGDGTAEFIEEKFPGIQVVESQERLFPGAARNRGADMAGGELLFFLDSDCVPEPAWISKMVEAHKHWDCAVVAGAIMNGNPELSVSVSSYMNEFSDFFPYGWPRHVDYLPSGNISYRASIFRSFGGFDSNEPMYEDLIFNKLLYRSGQKLLFDPGIKVWHSHRTGLREYLGHEFRRGKAAAVARRRGLIVGSSWTRYPALAFLAVPGLYLRKAMVFPYRLLKAYPTDYLRVIRALPCFWLALVVWHFGFLADVVVNRNQSRKHEKVAGCRTN